MIISMKAYDNPLRYTKTKSAWIFSWSWNFVPRAMWFEIETLNWESPPDIQHVLLASHLLHVANVFLSKRLQPVKQSFQLCFHLQSLSLHIRKLLWLRISPAYQAESGSPHHRALTAEVGPSSSFLHASGNKLPLRKARKCWITNKQHHFHFKLLVTQANIKKEWNSPRTTKSVSQ